MNDIEIAPTRNEVHVGWVDAPRLLETLFPDIRCRPSDRWLKYHQHEFPKIRIGRLVFFSPEQVRTHLESKASGRKGRA